MHRRPVEASRWLRVGLLSLATIVAAVAITTDPADARHRRKRYHAKRIVHSEIVRPRTEVEAPKRRAESESGSSRYADIVMDAKTGSVLHQSAPDGLRHPASLTKIMTLYMLFEKLESGKVKLWNTMEVSAEASSQAPTKLGLKPGSEITIEDAIKGLVTRSANDAAVVIAEALGGSEEEFARQMTRKARALGMTRTVYRNASGLPDDEQVTTARDQALLGIAIQERFPTYYRYFSTPSFVFRGTAIRNHNHLIGSVPGVDGIKTGYTNASGFNLVTSIRRADRHVVAVVLGGNTAGQRDARMRDLLGAHLMEASIGRTTIQVADASPRSLDLQPEPKVIEAKPAPKFIPVPERATMQLASETTRQVNFPAETTAMIPAPRMGSNEPIKPVLVKTVAVKLAAAKTVPAQVATKPAEPKVAEVKVAEAKPELKPEPKAEPAPAHSKAGVLGRLVVAAGNAIVPSAAAAERPRSGWAIQIGAYEEEGEAKQRLSAARNKAAGLLGKADPYTERTTKGEKTYYRARFAGFDRDQAESACKTLKRSDIVCMALKI